MINNNQRAVLTVQIIKTIAIRKERLPEKVPERSDIFALLKG